MTPEIYKSSKVVRYHANPKMMHRFQQTNGDHQWGVTALILLLNDNPSTDLIWNAMFHDAPELKAGDMPWPVKVANPEHAQAQAELEDNLGHEMGVGMKSMTPEEWDWLKFADRLESYLCMRFFDCHNQWTFGSMEDLLLKATQLKVLDQVLDLMKEYEND